jgi:hypothetical protein
MKGIDCGKGHVDDDEKIKRRKIRCHPCKFLEAFRAAKRYRPSFLHFLHFFQASRLELLVSAIRPCDVNRLILDVSTHIYSPQPRQNLITETRLVIMEDYYYYD